MSKNKKLESPCIRCGTQQQCPENGCQEYQEYFQKINSNGIDVKEIKDESIIIKKTGNQGLSETIYPEIIKKELKQDCGNKFDPVKKPFHYIKNGIEVIKIIDAFELDYYTGNSIKYILRSKFKNNEIEDLLKAKQYISRKIKQLQGKKGW